MVSDPKTGFIELRLNDRPDLKIPTMPALPHFAYISPGHRVLVVDDRQDAANSLAELLEFLGAEVRACYNGPAALDVASTWLPTAAILDLHMPGMDGFELVGRLKRSVPPGHLVALTGAEDDETHQRAAEAGFDLILTKRADLSELDSLLSSLSS